MIKGAETCETHRLEIFSVRNIFNFVDDDQINVFFRNIEKTDKKLVSLSYFLFEHM